MNVPPLPGQKKNWRWAAALNLFLPGAGLLYLGRRKLGATLALLFLACLLAALGIFLTGYAHYLNVVMGDDLMKEGRLEELTDFLHRRWLVGLLLVGLLLECISMLALSRARRDVLRKNQAAALELLSKP
jgi:hypothetical protein